MDMFNNYLTVALTVVLLVFCLIKGTYQICNYANYECDDDDIFTLIGIVVLLVVCTCWWLLSEVYHWVMSYRIVIGEKNIMQWVKYKNGYTITSKVVLPTIKIVKKGSE